MVVEPFASSVERPESVEPVEESCRPVAVAGLPLFGEVAVGTKAAAKLVVAEFAADSVVASSAVAAAGIELLRAGSALAQAAAPPG